MADKVNFGALDVVDAPVQRVRVASIRPNPSQPRQTFSDAEIASLAASMQENGLLQPVVVRPAADGDGFELVSGERRLRAAKRLGWAFIDAVVRDVDDRTMLVLALIENVQRAELTPLEEAEAYARLRDEHGLAQVEIAQAMGKDPSVISNTLRLLQLPATAKRALAEGQLTMSHVRALVSLDRPGLVIHLVKRAIEEEWTVRRMEKEAGALKGEPTPGPGRPRGGGRANPVLSAIEFSLEERFSTRVSVRTKGKGGEVVISFVDDEDFERLYETLTGVPLAEVVG